MAYVVIKTIRGRRYKYWQRAWREGHRVRTQCRCLGRIDDRDEQRSNTTPKRNEPPTPEAWRAELKEGLREVARRLEQEGNHYVVEQIGRIDVERSSREVLLKKLRALEKAWEGDNYAGEHLTETIARLAAFGNTTPEQRDIWRDELARKLGIAETWMPTKNLKEAVRTIIERAEIGSPENVITWLGRVDAEVDDSGQARKHLRSMIAYVRNTTGTHTDESLIEMLFTAEPTGEWQQPWSDTLSASGSAPRDIDPRVIAAPTSLGVTVKTLPFGSDSGIASEQIDGAFYNPTHDTIRIPDASRYNVEINGISGRDFFEQILLHETCHAAAHRTRLNLRFASKMTGSSGYAACEVLTDTAACLVLRKLGLKRPATWHNSVRYVQNWLKHAQISAGDIRALQSNALDVANYVTRHAKSDSTLPF